MEDELIGYTADEFLNMLSQFGNEAALAAARTTGTQAAAGAGLNAVAGLGSLLSPLSVLTSVKGIYDILDARKEAERAQRIAEWNAATQTMQQAGFDPYQTYSTDAVQGVFDAAPELAGIPGMDAGALSQQMIASTIDRFIRDPASYSTVVPPAQSLAPVDYVEDVLSLPGQIWEDPSSIFGVILGPGGVTGNVEWGGGTIDNAPGSAPAVYTGKIGDKVYTGASTGVPSVDAAIRRVLGQTEGGETTTMDVFEQAIEDATGFPAPAVADILETVFEDAGAATPTPAPPTAGGASTTTQPAGEAGAGDSQEKVTIGTDTGVQEKILEWFRKNKDATDEQIRTVAETYGVTPEDLSTATGVPLDEVQRRWDEVGAGQVLDTTATGGTTLDTSTGGTTLDTPTGSTVLDTVAPPSQGPTALEPEPEILQTPSTPAAGGGINLSALLGLGMPMYRTVTAQESPLAEIEYLYDIGGESIFAPKTGEPDEENKNLARIRRLGGVPYAQGGQIDVVELALQLLRG